MAGGVAAAEEHHEDDHEAVERRVIVLHTGRHQPAHLENMKGNRSFLGVQTVDLTPELREHFGVPRDVGVLVARIVEESPAAQSDLEVGDIISAVDGEDVTSPADLARTIAQHDSGDAVDLEIWREGRVHNVQSTLAQRERPWIDIRELHLPEVRLEGWEWSDDALEGAIELETETLNQAIERLNEELDSPEWQKRVHLFQEHQSNLMRRIEVLEQRLAELEKELEELPDDE
jgi:hypothetical protein